MVQNLSHGNEVAVFQTTAKDCGPNGVGYAMVTSGENAALTLDSGNIVAFLDDAAPNAILIGHMHVHDRATIFPSRSDYAFLERQSKKNGQKDSLIYPKQGDYAYRFGLPDSRHYEPATWALACDEWEGFDSESSGTTIQGGLTLPDVSAETFTGGTWRTCGKEELGYAGKMWTGELDGKQQTIVYVYDVPAVVDKELLVQAYEPIVGAASGTLTVLDASAEDELPDGEYGCVPGEEGLHSQR